MCLFNPLWPIEQAGHCCSVTFLNKYHSRPSYSAELRVVHGGSTSVAIAAGTVFGQVLVWTVSDPFGWKHSDSLATVCLRIIGHKVREKGSNQDVLRHRMGLSRSVTYMCMCFKEALCLHLFLRKANGVAVLRSNMTIASLCFAYVL